MPFGTPTITDRGVIAGLLALKPNWKPSADKVPAWKPVLYKGKQQIQIVLRERVSAAQYDKPSIPDVHRLSGTVFCKADLEGLPEVSLVLQAAKAVSDLVTHPCVAATEVGSQGGAQFKMRFAPPADQFELCHYQFSTDFSLPIRGFYQLKNVGPDTVKLLLQLKLHDALPNNFEYCEVLLPFRARGRVREIEGSPSCGTAVVDKDGHGVIWRIGPKFVGKQSVVSFPGVIRFHNDAGLEDADPFCVGLNTYAQVSFKMVDCSAAGVAIDASGISVLPPSKPKLSIVREIVNEDYKIWNSLGESRHCLPAVDTK